MVAEFEANHSHLRTREGMAKDRTPDRLGGEQPRVPRTARQTIHRRGHDLDDARLADLAEECSVRRCTIHRITSAPTQSPTRPNGH